MRNTSPPASRSETAEDVGLLSVGELNQQQFLIPYYQRGYRWTAEHVTQLLNDVSAFKLEEAPFYCLQPIVVRWRQEEGYWEVIDGQQRLTTMWLVQRLLLPETKPYSLTFENHIRQSFSAATLHTAAAEAANGTPPKSENESLEASYIRGAAGAIVDWKKHKTEAEVADFGTKLLDYTKVIWYETPAEDRSPAQTIFTRLNAGKIPLTEAELIKALLLKRQGSAHKAAYEGWQFELAAAWDSMEAALAEPAFGGWLRLPNNPDGRPRLEWLLLLEHEIQAKGSSDRNLALFTAVEERLKTTSSWHYWQLVEKVFQRLRAWHDDPGLYHRVGYLLATGNSRHQLKELLTLAETQGKVGFWMELSGRIAAVVNFIPNAEAQAWDTLEYGQYTDQLRKILLLHNVATAEQAQGLSGRFPFAAYHAVSWSLEHIHPQNPADDEPASLKNYQKWLAEWEQELREWPGASPETPALLLRMEDLRVSLLTTSEADTTRLQALAQEVAALGRDYFALFTDDDPAAANGQHPDPLHRLENLALLSQSDNSALGNGVFRAKRAMLLGWQQEAKKGFVPPATLQVFQKTYSKNPDDLRRWTSADRTGYRAAIEQGIGLFLTSPNLA